MRRRFRPTTKRRIDRGPSLQVAVLERQERALTAAIAALETDESLTPAARIKAFQASRPFGARTTFWLSLCSHLFSYSPSSCSLALNVASVVRAEFKQRVERSIDELDDTLMVLRRERNRLGERLGEEELNVAELRQLQAKLEARVAELEAEAAQGGRSSQSISVSQITARLQETLTGVNEANDGLLRVLLYFLKEFYPHPAPVRDKVCSRLSTAGGFVRMGRGGGCPVANLCSIVSPIMMTSRLVLPVNVKRVAPARALARLSS